MIFKMHVFYRQIVCAHMVSSQSLWEEADKAKALRQRLWVKSSGTGKPKGPLKHERNTFFCKSVAFTCVFFHIRLEGVLGEGVRG